MHDDTEHIHTGSIQKQAAALCPAHLKDLNTYRNREVEESRVNKNKSVVERCEKIGKL